MTRFSGPHVFIFGGESETKNSSTRDAHRCPFGFNDCCRMREEEAGRAASTTPATATGADCIDFRQPGDHQLRTEHAIELADGECDRCRHRWHRQSPGQRIADGESDRFDYL